MIKRKQTGKSMIEMLAVLAVIGVLSIIALAGFTYAMNKHRANETIFDVMLRGSNVPMIDENYTQRPAGYEFTFPSLGQDDGRMGTYYSMTTWKDDGSSYFVEVTDVKNAVCEIILKMDPPDIEQIIVDGETYEGNSQVCGSNTTATMIFCFGEDGSVCQGEVSSGSSGSSSGSGEQEEPCDIDLRPTLCHECRDGIWTDTCTGTEVCENGTCISKCPPCYKIDGEGNCLPNTSTQECCENFGSTWIDGSCQTPCAEEEQLCTNGNEYWCCKSGRHCGTETGQCCLGEKCCPAHQTPYCSFYDSVTGECKEEQCCTGNAASFDGLDICCSAEETPYCHTFSIDGTCTSRGCCSSTSSPMCASYYDNNICEKQICCSDGTKPICATFQSDGSCGSTTCCEESSTPYCTAYYDNGQCKKQSCCPSHFNVMAYQDKDRTIDVCCASDFSPFCEKEGTDGYCQETGCCGGEYHEVKSYDDGTYQQQICCRKTEEPYCWVYENGVCSHVACCQEGNVGCFSYDENNRCLNQNCCTYNQVLKSYTDGKNQFNVCCEPDESVFCASYNKDGSCRFASCCAGTPYCRTYDMDGNCTGYGCCDSGEPYCSSYYAHGTCYMQQCCAGTPYCYNYNSSGQCLDQACCTNGSIYCILYDENGQCQEEACCAGTVTQVDGKDVCSVS